MVSRKIHTNFGLIIFGMLTVAAAILIYFILPLDQELTKVTATITHFESHYLGGEYVTDVFCSFTLNGKFYDNFHLNTFAAWWKEGKEITLLINPDTLDHMTEFEQFLPYIVGAVGIGIIIIGIIIVKKENEMIKEEEQNAINLNNDCDCYENSNLAKYSFYSNNNIESYILKDDDAIDVYRVNLVKNSLIGGSVYDFYNLITNYKSTKILSNFLKVNGIPSFKIDKADSVKYINDLGYSYYLTGSNIIKIYKYNHEIATINVNLNRNVYDDSDKILTIDCEEEDLDAIILIAISIARFN